MTHDDHLELLRRAHQWLRGEETVTVTGNVAVDKDQLARDINNYLNAMTTHSHGCWSWGPAHYLCAYNRIKHLERMKESND